MKKSIILTILCLFSIFNYANTVTNLAKTAKNTALSVIDNTKSAVVGVVKTVDTSSNFKAIYSDLKDGVGALASSLKVGAEHVYIVIVKQQIVESITWTIILLVFIVITLYFWYQFNNNYKKTQDSTHDWYRDGLDEHFGLIGNMIIGVCLTIATLIIFTSSIQGIVSGYVNPEYGAMKDVINFVQSVSNGTCNTCY